MNVYFCSLGMKTYRFQVVKSQVTLHEQLLKQNLTSNAFFFHLLIASVMKSIENLNIRPFTRNFRQNGKCSKIFKTLDFQRA